MRKSALSIFLAGAILVPLAAYAQATVDLRIALPVVLPRLVVVSPGVEVVPDVDYEVFHVDGWYWVRHQDGWYRSRSHRGGWVMVPPRGVPPGLVRIPPGQYRRWHPAARPVRHDGDGWRHGDRHDGDGWRGDRHERHDDGGWGRGDRGGGDRGHDRGEGGGRGRKHGGHGRD